MGDLTSSDQGYDQYAAQERLTERQIKLEEARKAALEVELKKEQQVGRNISARLGGSVSVESKKPSARFVVVFLAVVILGVLAAFGFVIPSLQPEPETKVITESDLERVVNISKLATVDYVYKGIAEIPNSEGGVAFHAKYKAHVRAGFDMSDIKFKIDDENKAITVYAPDLILELPTIDSSEMGYLPENVEADLGEVIALCRDDAITEVGEEKSLIREKAYENFKTTIEGLTLPLIGDYQLNWADESGSNEGGVDDEE